MQNSMYYTTSGLTSLPAYQGGGYLDQYGRQSYGLGKLVKKITKPVAKVLDKIVPNEIKPALPFIAAAIPFVGPALSATLAALTPAQMALVAAGSNAISQLSQEGAAERGLNPLSLGLSALSGYGAGAGLQAPGAATASNIVGNVPVTDYYGLGTAGTTPVTATQLGSFSNELTNIASQSLPEISGGANSVLEAYGLGPTLPQQISNLGGSTTEFLGKLTRPGIESIQNIGSDPFAATGTDYLNAARTLTPGVLQASGELAYNAALDANKKYQDQLAAMGQSVSANRQQQIDYIRSAMQKAGFNDDEIASAITRSGFNQGGYAGYAKGGIMNLGGMEMDYRAKGGFVPIGKKERADDVPARLSKNEFVFTAKAVRNAGGGDIRKGAKKMYQIMNQLEAMV
jgi:hypothetical protein